MDRRQFSKRILMAGIGAKAGLAQAGKQSSSQKKTLKQRFHENDQINIFRVPSVATPEDVQQAIRANKPDLIYTDSQHEPYSDTLFKEQCQAAEDFGVGIQFRIPSLWHRRVICRFCDLGYDLGIRGHSTLKTMDDCKAYVRREMEGIPIKVFYGGVYKT